VFMSKGRIAWFLNLGFLLLNALTMIVTAILAVAGPASKAARFRPADSLRME
jgi:ABC-type antimicrobial peptide transport system permease subunit